MTRVLGVGVSGDDGTGMKLFVLCFLCLAVCSCLVDGLEGVDARRRYKRVDTVCAQW